MKKSLLVLMLVFVMLVGLTGVVAAAPGNSAELVSVIYVPGAGPQFTFHVQGDFSRAELNGLIHVTGGDDYGFHCNQQDENTVVCTTSKKTAGHNVTIQWGGFMFWTSVPVAIDRYCYGIWDWDSNSATAWVNYGSFCQNAPASYGDQMVWNNPVFGPSTYTFMPGSPNCFKNDIYESAYYYECPN